MRIWPHSTNWQQCSGYAILSEQLYPELTPALSDGQTVGKWLLHKLSGYSDLPSKAGMAELADAADSKSAGTWYLGGSSPPPGTSKLIEC